jgi:hypothetical protein
MNAAKIFTTFLFAMLFFSCKKDIDQLPDAPPASPSFPIPAPSPISGKVAGIVVDENNAAVAGAAVKVGNGNYTTDSRGLFETDSISLDKYVSTVTVSLAGYYKAYRSFSATSSRNFLTIKLVPKTLSATVDAATGGTVVLANNSSINLPGNGIVVKATGNAYTGSVRVYANYIDPTAPDFPSFMPGSMVGQDSASMFVLASAGMVAVELESPTGEPLQLAPQTTSLIRLAIPSSLQSSAPSSIATWSLNDRGIWQQEGTALRSGNFYEIQASHFSFWNADIPMSAVYLNLNLLGSNNQPLTNTLVRLSIPGNNSWWGNVCAYTDNNGKLTGLVPANTTLGMDIAANGVNCFSSVFNQNIGPFANDTTLTVVVTPNPANMVTVTGTTNDCTGQPIAQGTASIHYGAANYYSVPITQGAYAFSFPACPLTNSAAIRVTDNSTGNSSSWTNFNIANNTATVPVQSTCSATGNAVFNYVSCLFVGSLVEGTVPNSTTRINLTVDVQVPGTFSITTQQINGIYFSGSGTFSNTGTQTIGLSVSGTPNVAGTFGYYIGGAAGCLVNITVGSITTQQAVFSIGGPGACNTVSSSGNYYAGVPFNSNNKVFIQALVTTPGTYRIATDGPINGMQFIDSGVINISGTHTIALKGIGTPQAIGTNQFNTFIGNSTNATCNFQLTIVNPPDSAIYSYQSQSGLCSNATVAGNYQVGVNLLGQNTVAFQVNVIYQGPYSIATATTNGFRYTGSGNFSTTGFQTVLLTASGIPTTAGVTNFTLVGGSNPGCQFPVTVN